MGIEVDALTGLGWPKVKESELQNIAETWIALYNLPEDSGERQEKLWAYEKLSQLCEDEPDTCWTIIHLIRKLDGSDVLLANLAAGPLEDLLVKHGSSFIDRVETLANGDPQFRKVLGAVWQRDIPDAIWNRVKAVASPSW